MPVITLTVNGDMVSARDDQSLLDIIRENGIEIPTLCHLEGLSERGGCRLCLVEVQGIPKLLPACTTQAQEGMVVATHSERLIEYRKMILELLFAERNHICAVCVMNGHCELQSQAARVGMVSVRYEYLSPDLPMDATHDRYIMDHNRCILCTRCVRVCDEVEGAHTKDVMGRGVKSLIIHDMNQSWGSSNTCTSCGKCVQVCPTGALTHKGSTVSEMEKRTDFLPWIMGRRSQNGSH